MTIETRPAEVVSAPKVKTTADVLRHAAWIIEERGWTQGGYDGLAGELCALGAIYTAYGIPSYKWGAPNPAEQVLIQVVGDDPGERRAVPEFNDTPGRTAAEVTAALRAAADASERAS